MSLVGKVHTFFSGVARCVARRRGFDPTSKFQGEKLVAIRKGKFPVTVRWDLTDSTKQDITVAARVN